MRKALCLAMLCLGASDLCLASPAGEQTQSLLYQAANFLRAGRSDCARTMYEAVLFIDPGHAEARQLLNQLPNTSRPHFVTTPHLETSGSPFLHGDPLDRAREMQLMRFRAVTTGEMLPSVSPMMRPGGR